MPRREEIIAALYGAYLLARFDPRGMQYFDISLEGFWRSFFALALVVPFALHSLVTNYPETEASTTWVTFVVAAYYIVDWISFPLLMIPVAQALRLSHTYIPFIIASNWTTVVQSAVFFGLSLFAQTGALPLLAMQIIALPILMYVFMYQVFVARTAFGFSTMVAAALTVVDFVLSYWLLLQSERFY